MDTHYEVIRHGRAVMVPREQLTRDEALALAAEMQEEAARDERHATALEAWAAQHQGAA